MKEKVNTMTITYDKESGAVYIKFKTDFVNDTAVDNSGILNIDYAKTRYTTGCKLYGDIMPLIFRLEQ